ncbi:hypothetical protein Maes01_02770 [Microbulbifer aestuariivivens]|uniref:Restriction endonuclease n=1 Tax=Microbulbifer aestuariivivens TaxID=1908308 RepID=A0ABP9WSJ4_9GAMM
MDFEKKEKELIDEFMSYAFSGDVKASALKDEDALIAQILETVLSQFKRKKYVLGQALDFTMLAQKLSNHDIELKEFTPNLTIDEIFERYGLVESRGDTAANTLTLRYSQYEYGIRKIEESVANLFHAMDRSDYPSAYVYNTGQWKKFQDLMLLCFQLSESAKFKVCYELINFGLLTMPKNSFYIREVPRVRIFESVLKNYERGVKGENGGLVFQALAYGFLSSDRPHLSIVADKVRTGSSRQKRFGDIDCYFGMDLELSVEVKDFEITVKNFDKELGEFCRNCKGNNIVGIAFVREITSEAAELVVQHGVQIITQDIAISLAAYWDWKKQDTALQGTLHYISHIEQNPSAVERLLKFINEIDNSHDSLVYLKK